MHINQFVHALFLKFAHILARRYKFFSDNISFKEEAALESIHHSKLEKIQKATKKENILSKDDFSYYSLTVFDPKNIPGRKLDSHK